MPKAKPRTGEATSPAGDSLTTVDANVVHIGLGVLFRGAWEHKRVFIASVVCGVAFAVLQVSGLRAPLARRGGRLSWGG